jgi:putative drug exporter of the RND superfamily
MDYEVFILSRVKEDYARSGDAQRSVVTGLSGSARVITAAALIMMSVFGAFVLGDDVIIKMIGIGLAFAVLIDATVVRMVIVPAVMSLLGNAAWWYPKSLRWIPDLDVEGERLLEQLEVPPPSSSTPVEREKVNA